MKPWPPETSATRSPLLPDGRAQRCSASAGGRWQCGAIEQSEARRWCRQILGSGGSRRAGGASCRLSGWCRA